MSDGRVVLVPPAAPGSGGDEGMIRGAMEIFRHRPIVIFNPTRECLWLEALRMSSSAGRVSEASGPFSSAVERFHPDDTLVVIGADVVDGTCGLGPSLERCELILRALAFGLKVYVSLSVRSNIAPEILDRLRLLTSATFLPRDRRSLASFRLQVGANCRYFPDFAFFCAPDASNDVKATLDEIGCRKGDAPVIGVNFSEHSFRSFNDDHDETGRGRFVDAVMNQIGSAHPGALFVLFSNDSRTWPNHPSDDYYQKLALDWTCKHHDGSRALLVDGAAGYPANLALIGAVDLLVTGRMHLSIAACRAGTIPIVLMGQGKGYTSIDKMRGAFDDNLGDNEGVVSDIALLGETSVRFLASQGEIEARIEDIGSQHTAKNKSEVAKLMAEMEGDRSGSKGNTSQDALALALSSLIRRSDELAAERSTLERLRECAAVHDREAAVLSVRLENHEQTLSALRAELAGLRAEREAGEAEIATLRVEAATAAVLSVRLENHEQTLSALRAELAGLRAEREAGEAEIATLRVEAATAAVLSVRLENHEQTLSALRAELAGLRAEREAGEAEIATLRVEAATAASLRKDPASLDSRIATLYADHNAQEKTVGRLRADLVDRCNAIADHRMETLRLREALTRRGHVLDGQREALAGLRRDLAERDRLDSALDHASHGLLETGAHLARDVSRAYARPWRTLPCALQRLLLTLVLLFSGVMSERRRGKLRGAREKRSSRRFKRLWQNAHNDFARVWHERNALAERPRESEAAHLRLCELVNVEVEPAEPAPEPPPPVADPTPENWDPTPVALERRRNGRLNILYFSPFPSHPDNHGNQATIQSFGRRFQRLGHRVHFALLESAMYNEQSLADMRAAWDTLDLLPNSRPLWADGSDIPFDHWYQPGLGENIRRLCWKYDIDVVFCSYVFQSKLLEHVPAHLLKVIDTHDKMGNRYDMLRANGQPVEFFSCTPEEEGAYLRRADLVMARRAEEAKYFNSMTGLETALVLPHVEDARFIDKKRDALRRVGVVASANRINLIILHDFLAEIARRCGDSCPFEVVVAGQVRDMVPDLTPEQQAAFARPWLRMLGFVPTIASFYAQADVIVSPVTMGTGINVKTVQSMAFGMPLLTTRAGIKGIETGEALHHHELLAELVDLLLALAPEELARLAQVSVNRYNKFLVDADGALKQMFSHPKVSAKTPA